MEEKPILKRTAAIHLGREECQGVKGDELPAKKNEKETARDIHVIENFVALFMYNSRLKGKVLDTTQFKAIRYYTKPYRCETTVTQALGLLTGPILDT